MTNRGFAVFGGRTHIGSLVCRGKHVDAYDASGVYLGEFRNLQAPSGAVTQSLSVLHRVRDVSERGGGRNGG